MRTPKQFLRFGRMIPTVVLAAALNACSAAVMQSGLNPRTVNVPMEEVSIGKTSRITVLYVGADNCRFCKAWKRNDFVAWSMMSEFKEVVYHEVETPDYRNTLDLDYWPDDLEWIAGKANASGAAPRFIVLVDDTIVLNQLGLGGWRKVVAPRIKELVARRADL